MIKRLLQGGASLAIYFCLATLISQVVLAAYVGFTWRLDRTKIVQMLAILQDIDLFAIREAAKGDEDESISGQVSYEQIIEARALKVRHLELREKALSDALERLRFERRKLADDQKSHKRIRLAFNALLLEEKQGAIAKGIDEVVLILTSANPKQSKEQLVQILDNDELDVVVALLAALPDKQRSKIIAEFKTPDEAEQLGQILRRMREGYPDVALPEETLKQLEQPQTK